MHKETAIEGIILKSTPFKETKMILHLFTNEFGLISVIGAIKKNSYLSSMMLIEGYVKKGKSDLFTLKDPHILNCFTNLRSDFSLLQMSMKMMNILAKTLVKDRAIAPIFTLTKNTLNAFCQEKNNEAIYFCYLLKLLLFEGLLPLDSDQIETTFSEEEKNTYLTLATTKKFAELEEVPITPFFKETIETYLLTTLH